MRGPLARNLSLLNVSFQKIIALCEILVILNLIDLCENVQRNFTAKYPSTTILYLQALLNLESLQLVG
jgi:hypothetical protein